MEAFAVIAAVAFLAFVAWYFDHRDERKRTGALAQIADELGFEFLPAGDRKLQRRLSDLPLLSQGASRKLWNLFRRERDLRQVFVFDYRYDAGGQGSSVRVQTVACLRAANSMLPRFELHPKTVWDRIGRRFGSPEIVLDGHAEFAGSWVLRGDDEAAIRELFTDEVVAFYRRNSGLTTEAAGDKLILYLDGKRITPESIAEFLDAALEVRFLLHSAAHLSHSFPD